LHRHEPGVAGQPAPDLPGERVDLEIQGSDVRRSEVIRAA
jgi:hypothetical protein